MLFREDQHFSKVVIVAAAEGHLLTQTAVQHKGSDEKETKNLCSCMNCRTIKSWEHNLAGPPFAFLVEETGIKRIIIYSRLVEERTAALSVHTPFLPKYWNREANPFIFAVD